MKSRSLLIISIISVLLGFIAPGSHPAEASTVERAPVPEALYNCKQSAIHRDSTSSGYVSGSTVCTSGTGGIYTRLVVSAGGTRLADNGPCVGKFSGSPAYVWVPWYLGGPSRATVVYYNELGC
jgi:hypothetical protein